jgi:hypothetical protein
MLDHSSISSDELAQQLYGASTARAVLEYKKQRKIINFSYQVQADDVVGKMTIGSLDREMLAHERGKLHLLLALGISGQAPKIAIVSQGHPLPATWAKQLADAHKPNVIVIPPVAGGSSDDAVKTIKRAISTAKGGMIIFAVGHGIIGQGLSAQGGFDVADNVVMRIGGKGSNRDPKTFVDVFYDDKNPASGGLAPRSDKKIDENLQPAGADRRLKNWNTYLDLCKAFVAGKMGGIVLLTCNVGKSSDFLRKVASQWQTPIIAYRQFTRYVGGFPGGRVRSVLESDVGRDKSPNPGTNTPFAEVMFPLSMSDMVLIRP